MSDIKRAKIVLKELKKNGYEGYIVGGAVRDHLLRMPLTDIDITTNAKPHEVSKIFKKTKPTGIKYGTVSVYIGEDIFEVTTYRLENGYKDHRHPSDVNFSDSVLDDVSRRDFTINGLLMDETGLVTDLVGGQSDLNAKMIRTIGDPKDRFNEDALRMLRAFYFQAKLGFQIDAETRLAISTHKDDLLKISSERVMTELIKTFKGPYLKRAVQSIVSTGVHEVLPGLKKGFEYINQLDEMPFVDAFFTLSFALNKGVDPYWPFSNKHRHKYEMASQLANQYQRFDPMTLYTYGIDLCLLANKVNTILNRTKNQRSKIEKDFSELPVKSELDLVLKPFEMMKMTGKKPGAWLKEVQQAMVVDILNKKLKNNKEDLKTYVLNYLKNQGEPQ
ncbi:MAG: CCA tRNA nucleotidyltransferase [Acholeplasmataceae bacterium]